MKGINLGCGKVHKTNSAQYQWVNVDWQEPADVICDVTKGLPFEDVSVDRIEADNLLEHLDWEGYKTVLNECFRILKPGGVFWFKVPDALNWPDAAFGDPTHVRFFTPRSFLYLKKGHQTHEMYGKEYGLKGWDVKVETDNKFFTCELSK